MATVKQVLNANAITALAALAITIPLAARVFDLSFAYTMTLTGVVTAHFLSAGVPLVPAVLLGLGAGVVIGVVNGIVVVVMRIDSFIATLATGSLIAGADHDGDRRHRDHQHEARRAALPRSARPTSAASRSRSCTCSWSRSRCGSCSSTPRPAGGCTPPDSTPTRRSLPVSASTACGSCRSWSPGRSPERRGSCSPRRSAPGTRRAGTSYLLPAFAAAFLGATQLKHGRFNACGTLIAVLLLGTGTTGLALANAPQWSADMFVGARADRVARRDRHPAPRDASETAGGSGLLLRRLQAERRLT